MVKSILNTDINFKRSTYRFVDSHGMMMGANMRGATQEMKQACIDTLTKKMEMNQSIINLYENVKLIKN